MISVTIISLNEEENIEEAIKSVVSFVDEVILVDSGSKDKTVEIAEKLGAKVFFRKFDNFANQKNFAAEKASGKWILSVDADEEISIKLGEEIKKAVENRKYSGFLIPRRNFILNQEIKYSRWSPDKHIWLWRKDKGKWVGDVHEEVEVVGKIGELSEAKINYQDKTINTFLEKNNFYASLYAKTLFRKGVKFSLFHLISDPIFEFLLRYIYKLGFLDGLKGFILCYLMAIYKISIWIKIYELQNLK